MADFWVSTEQGEEIQLVLRPGEAARIARGECLYPALEAWTGVNSMVLRLLSPDQIDDTEILCRNRLIMLNYQKMNRGRPDAALSEAIVKACAVGCTLFNLEQRFDAFEPTLVRAVVFSLVLAGALNCPTLAAQPLGRETYLVAR